MPEALINGARIYYQEHGKGPPLVLSHGLGSDHTMWLLQARELRDRFRVVLWDFRGHGRSEITEEGYSLEMFVSDLRGLLRYLGIEEAHIGGLSLGGLVAWSFALAFPEMTRSLVISDSAGLLEGMSEKEKEDKQKLFETSAAVAKKDGRSRMADATISLMFSEKFIKSRPDLVEQVKSGIMADPGQGYARTIEHLLLNFWKRPEDEVKEDLGRISTSCLVLAGELDQLTPLPTQQALHRSIPGSRFVLIKGAGHVPCLEKPGEWNRAVLEFLSSVEGG
ncbi:MAG: alpha/beta fold hydrolase [bacterium]